MNPESVDSALSLLNQEAVFFLVNDREEFSVFFVICSGGDVDVRSD